ncbi:phosphoglycerate mutase 2 [Lunasporangiospora selenospora]|uniref:Phosphoglycerate mutase 2 n=1 Tax=Lunasporangiospora selenospora TaxID=979761 RepID=A0A9P6KAI5_9FUNG|nr:phosphoglycerate mutase 2 [Lunasporangiospora selenospora]
MVHIDNITLVLVSPLQRAQQTYEQLRNGGIAREQQTQQQNPNSPPRPSCFTQTQARTSGMLVEWDYGDYEGVTTKEILKTRPNWSLFGDNVPNGETVEDVSARADAIIALIHNYQRGIDPNGDSTTALTMPKTRIELERQKSLQNQETVPADSAQEGTILDETNCVQIPTDVGRRDVLVVAHGHFLRVFAARWLKLNGLEGRNFVLDTASVSVLGYEHTLEERVIKVWNSPAHY